MFDKLSKGAHIYFCGLKGMMPGILGMLEKVAKKKKLNWETTLKDLKKKGKSQDSRSPMKITLPTTMKLCTTEMRILRLEQGKVQTESIQHSPRELIVRMLDFYRSRVVEK